MTNLPPPPSSSDDDRDPAPWESQRPVDSQSWGMTGQDGSAFAPPTPYGSAPVQASAPDTGVSYVLPPPDYNPPLPGHGVSGVAQPVHPYAEPTPPDGSPSPRGRSAIPWILPAGVGLASLALGLVIGFAAAGDVVDSPEYQALASELDATTERADTAEARADDVQDELDELSASLDERNAELDSRSSELDDRQSALDTRETGLDEREGDLDEREKAVSGKEAEKKANTFGDGTYSVGIDISPGTYRTEEPVSSGFCYWGIYRGGTNKEAIVSNDIVSGGTPTVSLKEGQDFESTRCGSWTKQ